MPAMLAVAIYRIRPVTLFDLSQIVSPRWQTLAVAEEILWQPQHAHRPMPVVPAVELAAVEGAPIPKEPRR
ncbi:hypothetical protein BMF89_14315 [Arthrobacter sp. SRS-W-1-2016]|nr:hypothetical protein BMF89_14315 [Arthrobacter sp. SRS-W-1-2016]